VSVGDGASIQSLLMAYNSQFFCFEGSELEYRL